METKHNSLETLPVTGLPKDLTAFFPAWINGISTLSCWIDNKLSSLLITGIQKIMTGAEPQNSFIISATVNLPCEEIFLVVTSEAFETYQPNRPYKLASIIMYKGSYDSFVLHSNKAAEDTQMQELHDATPDHRS
jgi:hypothetical protein